MTSTSKARTTRRRRWFTAAAVVIGLVVFGMLPQLLIQQRGVIPKLIYFITEATLTVVLLSLHYERAANASRAEQLNVTRTLFGSMAIAAFVGMVCAASFFIVIRSLGIRIDERTDHLTVGAVMVFGAVSGIFQCALWALGFVYPYQAEDARLRALEAEKLKLEAEKLKLETEQLRVAAELAHLRSQLEPHFLLNTLNAIAGLVTQRPKEARRLLGCLGDLLRDSLRDFDPNEMQTLDAEMTWLHRYAEILESRHSGVLQFRWELSDDARNVMLPRLLLQPLVENAVNHGALQRPSGGGGEVTVKIAVERGTSGNDDREQVVCTIEDNGPGMAAEAPRSGAFGLRSVRRRLELKYDDANLRLESTSQGTRAIVRLPRVQDQQQS